MNLSTINQQSEESLSQILKLSYGQGGFYNLMPDGNLSIKRDAVKQFIREQTKKDLELFLAEILPEKIDIWGDGISDDSDIIVYGYNRCLDEIKQRVEKFMNN